MFICFFLSFSLQIKNIQRGEITGMVFKNGCGMVLWKTLMLIPSQSPHLLPWNWKVMGKWEGNIRLHTTKIFPKVTSRVSQLQSPQVFNKRGIHARRLTFKFQICWVYSPNSSCNLVVAIYILQWQDLSDVCWLLPSCKLRNSGGNSRQRSWYSYKVTDVYHPAHTFSLHIWVQYIDFTGSKLFIGKWCCCWCSANT